jgi:hypothetical protein
MIKVDIGDIYIIEKVFHRNMAKGTSWKVTKLDMKTKHYEFKNVDPKTGREIAGRVANSFELKEIETFIKRKELRKI